MGNVKLYEHRHIDWTCRICGEGIKLGEHMRVNEADGTARHPECIKALDARTAARLTWVFSREEATA